MSHHFYLNNLSPKNTASKIALIVANFGGPRNQEEVPSFLEALLTDEDVIRTPLPAFLQKKIFQRVARKRAVHVAQDYAKIGGGSPIFADTEWMAGQLQTILQIPTLCFHRYLTDTHGSFLQSLERMDAEKILVFPLFPQFSYVTTGSIAKWFSRFVDKRIEEKMHWIFSYAGHEAYIGAFSELIGEFLEEKNVQEATLVFSAHGLPVKYIEEGDIYQKECEASFTAISQKFPNNPSLLAYQSQFGKGKWLSPSTLEVCQAPHLFLDTKRPVVFIPLSFSSDHIETLFEIEEQYVRPLKEKGIIAFRCPALNRRESWVQAVSTIIQTLNQVPNNQLLRKGNKDSFIFKLDIM